MFTELLKKLSHRQADFEEVMAHIQENFDYVPTAFSNGLGDHPVVNAAGKNEGSCRIFALAKLENLSESDTLLLFGRFYHDDVLKNPEAESHANIRRFMRDGWAGIRFEQAALRPKKPLKN